MPKSVQTAIVSLSGGSGTAPLSIDFSDAVEGILFVSGTVTITQQWSISIALLPVDPVTGVPVTGSALGTTSGQNATLSVQGNGTGSDSVESAVPVANAYANTYVVSWSVPTNWPEPDNQEITVTFVGAPLGVSINITN